MLFPEYCIVVESMSQTLAYDTMGVPLIISSVNVIKYTRVLRMAGVFKTWSVNATIKI